MTTQTAEQLADAIGHIVMKSNASWEAAAMLRSQAAEIERLRLDAERYRFCFSDDNYVVCKWETPAPFSEEYGDWKWLAKDEADRWIDAARAALEGNHATDK